MILIRRSEIVDTRTCDFTKVSKETRRKAGIWWALSRLFFALGAVSMMVGYIDRAAFDLAICGFLMAICSELYAQEE